jgi:6-phosphofructokinase 1
MRNIGILTGGGDCPGLNAVIRATYKTLKDSCDCRIIGIRDGYDGLIFDNCEEITPEMARGILAKGGTILGTSNKGNPMQYPVEQADGTIQFVDYSDRILETYNKYELEGIIIIGGEGSLYIADTLSRKGIKYIGVPKTIDNDIYGTDMTFGFNTAVQLATDAIDRIHTTAESHHRIMIVETMGRDSGFIALYSGIAGGGDVILIPEIPYSMDAIVKKLKDRYDVGKNFSIMVVSEGAKPVGGEVFGKENKKNIYDRIKLGGIGMKLADEIEKLTGFESRATVLGYLQRGGTPTSYDRILATRYGCAAARAFLEGKFGNMVALDGNDIVLRNVSENAGKKRLIELDSPLLKDAKNIGICLGI